MLVSLKVNNLLHDCTVVSFEAHHNSCVNCSLHLHLIVPYNSIYYNYITITQWLVGWFEDQGKKEVCVGKKVHCGPVYQYSQLILESIVTVTFVPYFLDLLLDLMF